MMEIPILSDKAKLDKWNDICISQDWAQQGELEKWLMAHGIFFTGAGSCLNTSIVVIKMSSSQQAIDNIKNSSSEEMATNILLALTGIMIFSSSECETDFWKAAIERLNVEADMFMPPEIMPKPVRESLKYPADTNNGAIS
jgi:hypothetical protein